MNKSFLILFQSNDNVEIQRGIDMALAICTYEPPLSLCFEENAWVHLIKNKEIETDIQKQLKALPSWYDIHSIYAITKNNLIEEDFIFPLKLLNKIEIKNLIKNHDIVLSY